MIITDMRKIFFSNNKTEKICDFTFKDPDSDFDSNETQPIEYEIIKSFEWLNKPINNTDKIL